MREMAQPRFAGGDGRGGAAHVAQHESGKQREAGERDRDERNHAVDDFGAGLLRRPGETRDEIAFRAREIIGKIARSAADPAPILRKLVSRNCAAMLVSALSSMNLTDMTIGAASSEDAVSPAARPRPRR